MNENPQLSNVEVFLKELHEVCKKHDLMISDPAGRELLVQWYDARSAAILLAAVDVRDNGEGPEG